MPPRVVAEPDLVIDLRDPPETDPELAGAPRRGRRDIVLLLALNALNLLDAALTFSLTRAGIAVEGNPLVGWLTLPGKLAFVAALSVLLWKLRPQALWIPVAAYAAVVCYTIVGAITLG